MPHEVHVINLSSSSRLDWGEGVLGTTGREGGLTVLGSWMRTRFTTTLSSSILGVVMEPTLLLGMDNLLAVSFFLQSFWYCSNTSSCLKVENWLGDSNTEHTQHLVESSATTMLKAFSLNKFHCCVCHKPKKWSVQWIYVCVCVSKIQDYTSTP